VGVMPTCAIPLPGYDRQGPPPSIVTALGDSGDHREDELFVYVHGGMRRLSLVPILKNWGGRYRLFEQQESLILAVGQCDPAMLVTDDLAIIRQVRSWLGFECKTELVALVDREDQCTDALMNGASSAFIALI